MNNIDQNKIFTIANIASTSCSTVCLGNSLNFILFLDSIAEMEYYFSVKKPKHQ